MIWLVGTMWLSLAAALLIGVALGWILFRAGRRTIKQSDWDRVEDERAARQSKIRELDDEVKRLRPVAARVPSLEGEKAGYHAAQRRVAELEAESSSLRSAAASTSEAEHEAIELRSELTNRAVRIGELERELAKANAAGTVDLRQDTAPVQAAVPVGSAPSATTAAAAGTVAGAGATAAYVASENNGDAGASNSLADAEVRRQMASRDRRIEQLETRIRRLEAPGNGAASAASTSDEYGSTVRNDPSPVVTAPVTTAPVVNTPAATAPVVTAPVVSAPTPPPAPPVATRPLTPANLAAPAPPTADPVSPPAPAMAVPVQTGVAQTVTQSSTLSAPPIPPAPASGATSAAPSSRATTFSPPVPDNIERGTGRIAQRGAVVAGGAVAGGAVAGSAVTGTLTGEPAASTNTAIDVADATPTTAPRRTTDAESHFVDHAATGDQSGYVPTGGRDDLTEIIGIGPKLEGILNGLGITTLSQLANLDDAGAEDLQRRLPDFPGRVRRDDWAGQARRVLSSRR